MNLAPMTPRHAIVRRRCKCCRGWFPGYQWQEICPQCKPVRQREIQAAAIERRRADQAARRQVELESGNWRDPAIFGELDRLIAAGEGRGKRVEAR